RPSRSGIMADTIPKRPKKCPPSNRNAVRHDAGTLSAISPESCPPWAGTRIGHCSTESTRPAMSKRAFETSIPITTACAFPIAPLRLPTLRKCELLLAHATVRDHQRDPVGRHLLLSGLRSPGGGTDCPTGVASQKHRLCMSRLDIQGVARSDGVVGFETPQDHPSATLSRPALLDEEGKGQTRSPPRRGGV